MPSDSPTPASAPLSRIVSRALRVLRGIVLFAILLVVVAFAGTHLFAPNADASAWPIRLLFAVAFVVGPAMAFASVFRNRPQTWPPYATLTLSVTLLVIWLMHDDYVLRHPPGTAALRSDFPNAESTHSLTLRYSQNVPGSLYGTVKYPTNLFKKISPAFDTSDKDREWIAFVTENRAHIEAGWDELAHVRSWVEEMAAAPEIADRFETFSDPIIAFQPLREVSNYASARALLYALDRHPDEAVATILPIFTAAQKLEVHAITLDRRMVAIVTQKSALTALRVVLDNSEVPSAARARIAAALTATVPVEENARQLFLCEYEANSIILEKLRSSALPVVLNGKEASFIRYLPLYNHNATMNLAGDLANDLASLNARRDLAGIKNRQTAFINSIPGPFWPRKNLFGYIRLKMNTSPYNKRVTGNFWEAQDWRAALIRRL